MQSGQYRIEDLVCVVMRVCHVLGAKLAVPRSMVEADNGSRIRCSDYFDDALCNRLIDRAEGAMLIERDQKLVGCCLFARSNSLLLPVTSCIARHVLPKQNCAFRVDWLPTLGDHDGKLGIDRHAAEELDLKVLGEHLAAALAEEVGAFGAVWAHKAAHVLYNTNHLDSRLFAKVELFANICSCHCLWSGDQHTPGQLVSSREL